MSARLDRVRRIVRALLPADLADAVLADLERERAARPGAHGAWLLREGGRVAARLRAARAADRVGELLDGGVAGIGADVRHAARAIGRSPGVLVLATVVLALGIAAPTIMYSLGRGIMRDLPVTDPDGLVHVGFTSLARSPRVGDLRGAELAAVRARPGSAATVAAYAERPMDLVSDGRPPERVVGARVTADLFGVLGTPPVRGRDFADADARPGAPPVALVGEPLARDRFGGVGEAVGAMVRVDGTVRTIVGVVPEGIRFPGGAEVWVPVALDGADPVDARTPFGGIARIPDGAELARVAAGLDGLVLPAREVRAGPFDREVPRVVVRPYREELIPGPARDVFSGLLALMGCILFVACANVANLLLARAVHRQREASVRVALGAGRVRILAHYVAEAAVVAALGTLVAVGLAHATLETFDRAAVGELAWWMRIRLDGGGLLFAAALGALAALAAGLAPALQLMGRDLAGLRGAQRAGGDFRAARISQTLVLVEVTLSTIALTVGALIVREMSSYLSGRAAFDVERAPVLVGRYDVAAVGAEPEPGVRRAFHRALHDRLAAEPDVAAAAVAAGVPGQALPDFPVVVEGVPDDAPGGRMQAQLFAVSPGLPDVVGGALVRGRDLSWRDGAEDPPAVLVNERFGELLGDRDPLGVSVTLGPPLVADPMSAAVVGVVRTLGRAQPNRTGAIVYLPIGVTAPASALMLARAQASGEPAALLPSMRAALRAVDPHRPVHTVFPLGELIRRERRTDRFFRGFFVVFGLAGLVMAGTGLFGVVSFAVARRTHEVGLRVALGADPVRVGLAVLRGFGARVGAGALAGVLLVWLGAPAFVGMLDLGAARDPLPYVLVSIVLVLTALVAVAVPLRRALTVQPTEALRAD